MEQEDRPTVSVNQACEIVGVSRRTIYNWINLGKIDYLRTAGGAIRIVTVSLWRDRRNQRLEPPQEQG